MKLLALEKDVPGVADNAFTDELLKQEAARAWKLQQAGVLRELYFRADREAAVLVLECANIEEARTILSTLPLVKNGFIEFDVIPLKAYPGFARLFEENI
ncbi:MAG TPA: muconolactone Delta-isomerase family protein [Bacteroidota bacterium]|nr:muconolactone Delta-isomerase family protein [Bacteroidota bacterium]